MTPISRRAARRLPGRRAPDVCVSDSSRQLPVLGQRAELAPGPRGRDPRRSNAPQEISTFCGWMENMENSDCVPPSGGGVWGQRWVILLASAITCGAPCSGSFTQVPHSRI